VKTAVLISSIAILMSGCSASLETGPIIVGGTSYAGADVARASTTSDWQPVIEATTPAPISAKGLTTYRSNTHFTVALLFGRPAGKIMEDCLAEGGQPRSQANTVVNASIKQRQVALKQAPSQRTVSNEGTFYFLEVHNIGKLSPDGFALLNKCVEAEAFKNPQIKWTNENLVL
jgi:hypothetical protein